MPYLKRKQESAGVDARLESQTKKPRRLPASAAPHVPALVIGTNKEDIPGEDVVNGDVIGAAKDAVPLSPQGADGKAASASISSTRQKSKTQASAASPEPILSRPGTEHPDACQQAPLSGSGGERCLITNEEGARPFHLVPRETWAADIIAFEEVWRYGHNKLRADDKHNVIFVSDTIRDLLETDQIILVPEVTLVATLLMHYFNSSGEPRHDTSSQPRHIVDLYEISEGAAPTFTYYMIPSNTCNPDLRLTRYSADGQPTELPYPFLDVGPIQSHVLPHFAVVRAAMTWIVPPWDFTENGFQILRKHADLEKTEVECILQSLQLLYSFWTRDADKYARQPARRWLSPVCAPTDLVDASIGRSGLASPPVSEDGDMESEESTEDPDAGPRPCLPGTVDADLGTYIEDWARLSHTHVASQKIARAWEAKQRLRDPDLRRYAREKSPAWLRDVDWKAYRPSWLSALLDGSKLTIEKVPDSQRFSSIDWALWEIATEIW